MGDAISKEHDIRVELRRRKALAVETTGETQQQGREEDAPGFHRTWKGWGWKSETQSIGNLIQALVYYVTGILRAAAGSYLFMVFEGRGELLFDMCS